MTPAPSGRIPRQDLLILGACCAMVAVAFAILWKGNDSTLYSELSELDAWCYVGYALHWLDPEFLASYYKASRLPWILYEFVNYQLFGPQLAVPIVQVSCYLSLLAGNYLFLRRLFEAEASENTLSIVCP